MRLKLCALYVLASFCGLSMVIAEAEKPKITKVPLAPDTVTHHCPLFAMYPIGEDTWAYYCDGVSKNGADPCVFEEATILELRYDVAPYAACTGDCIAAVTDPKTPFVDNAFSGYPAPYWRSDSTGTQWRSHHGRSHRRFGLATEPGPRSEKIAKVNLGAEGGTNYRYFKIFKMPLPNDVATGVALRYRLFGLQLEDVPPGEPDLIIRSARPAAHYTEAGKVWVATSGGEKYLLIRTE